MCEEVQRIFDWVLVYYVSMFNLKLCVIFGEYWQIVDNVLIKIGYCFCLVLLSYELVGQSGIVLMFNSCWVNEGVVLIYFFYMLLFCFVDVFGKFVVSGELKEDFFCWLFGEYMVDFLLDMLWIMLGGSYFIEVVIVDKLGVLRIWLVNEGQ